LAKKIAPQLKCARYKHGRSFPKKFFLQKFEKCLDKSREIVIEYFLILF
jgi:hypothetical protein